MGYASTGHDKARIKSCQGHVASAWLHAVPASEAFEIDSEMMKTALRFRLGMETMPRQQWCLCGSRTEGAGDHYLVCKHGHHRSIRHDQVAEQIRVIFLALGKVARTKGLHDVIPAAAGQPLLMPDVHCPDTQQVLDIPIIHPRADSYRHRSLSS